MRRVGAILRTDRTLSTVIRIEDELRLLPGMACGIPQSTLALSAWTDAVTEDGIALIASRLRTVIEEPLAGIGSGGPSRELARIFCFCHGALQRQSRIGVSERFHFRQAGDPTPEGQQRFALMVPTKAARPLTQHSVRLAAQLVNRLAQGEWSAADAEAFRKHAEGRLKPFAEPGMNRFLMIRAAHRQGIPVRGWMDRYLVLGTGTHTRWVESSVTDRTPMLGVVNAKDKQRTARILRDAGLPGGVNQIVNSRERAIEAAMRLGYPVVVKPNDRDRGEGVTADLRNAQAVGDAYDEAVKVSKSVLVEKHAAGYTHRLNVRFGRVDRCARKIAGVIGDGTSGMEALVAQQQQTPAHRNLTRMHGRPLLSLDEEALGLLRQEGRDASYVPAVGEYVRLRRRDNATTGGTNVELDYADPAVVHPDNIRLAEDAAGLLLLDIAGVDVIMEDISKSWLETGALVCEVNSQPQIPRMDLIEPLVRELVGGGDGRIPAELYVCPSDPAVIADCAAKLVASGRFDGVSTAAGLIVRGARVTQRFAQGFAAARALLMRRDVAAAAVVMSAKDVASHGLPLDRWTQVHVPSKEAFPAAEQADLSTARFFLSG